MINLINFSMIWTIINSNTFFAIFDPLDQFEIIPLHINYLIYLLYLHINLILHHIFPTFAWWLQLVGYNMANIFFINCSILCFLFLLTKITQKDNHIIEQSATGQLYYKLLLSSLSWKWIVEANIIEEESTTYYILGAFIFIFILISNVIGLIPYSFTNTSSLIYTLYIALAIFLGIIIVGITQQKYEFFNFFLPSGSPFILTPLIAFVELFSFASRVFSLAIRLFANMMAGHTLLKILIGFSWIMLGSSSLLVFFSLIPWIVVTIILGLESVIACLQAYVFVTLIMIYINDFFNLH